MNAKASFRSFEESTEADWKIIQNDFPVTQALAAANIIEQLRILERDDGGFPVSRPLVQPKTAAMMNMCCAPCCMTLVTRLRR